MKIGPPMDSPTPGPLDIVVAFHGAAEEFAACLASIERTPSCGAIDWSS